MSREIKNILQSICNTEIVYYIWAMPKRTILTVEIEPDLMEHLRDRAKKNDATVSRYVRNKLKKSTGYKEKELK